MLTVEQLAHIDIYGEFDRRLGLGKKRANTNSGEYWTHCPFCGCGEDRFKIWPYRSDNTIHYWCRQCGVIGDVVKFIMEVENRDFLDVCEELEVKLDGEYVSAPKRLRRYDPHEKFPPSKEWQEIATAFAAECKNILWSEEGKGALAWLRARGLSDETIKNNSLGYNPITRFDNPVHWFVESDKKVWLPRGITIPWQVDRQLWAINIRRDDVDIQRDKERGVEHPAKYVLVKGSSEGVYGIDYFQANKPTLLVEGEFDKLIAGKVAGDSFNCLATGSISKARGERWALTIAQSPVVLIGYDNDGKGEKAAKDYWLKAIPHAIFWPPTNGKDYNDMLLAGGDIKSWLETGVEMSHDARMENHIEAKPVPILAPVLSLDTILATRNPQMQYNTTVPPDSVCCQCNSLASFISPGGYTYCPDCYWCRRGHRPVWRQDPNICKADDSPLWICSCYWEQEEDIQPIRKKYIPLTLPALPRKQCPHHRMVLQQDGGTARQKRGPLCGQPTTYHGWCDEHALSHDLLELGTNLGYPSVDVNQYRGILDGCANWEGYAEVAPKKWLTHDITSIRVKFNDVLRDILNSNYP